MRSKKNSLTILGLILVVLTLGVVRETTAQFPGPRPNVYDGGNRWLINSFPDCDPAHPLWATQGICFLPYKPCGSCSITGYWYSDTYPKWRGGYMQEGDRILMHGNWHWPNQPFAGSDGMVIDLFAGTSPRDEGAGQWTEWLNSGTFGTPEFYFNTRLRRVGRCEIPHAADLAAMSQADLEKLSIELSDRVKPRLRKDGKPATYPSDPEQVPLKEEKEYR